MLDCATFPVISYVDTRFADIDPLRHVNNVAAVSILQEGRTDFDRASGLRMIDGCLRTMVAGLIVEYAAELAYPGRVEIRTGLLSMGHTSFTLAQVALQDGLPALYSLATMVMADRNGPSPIPASVRAAYDKVRIT